VLEGVCEPNTRSPFQHLAGAVHSPRYSTKFTKKFRPT
jgi:hypothetical protein